MSSNKPEWLSLSKAAERLGVHRTTLRRWADAGKVPCFLTPGGHRRFRSDDLGAWMEQQQRTMTLAPQTRVLVQSAVRFARHDMSSQHVANEPWHQAFDRETDRQEMRDTGRKLLGLAIQYTGRTSQHEPLLREARLIAEFYGRQSAIHRIALVDTMRAYFFFRESLLRMTRPGLANRGQYDAEDVRIHREMRRFLDEAMYACLASYEATCRSLQPPEITA
jgi:excisionase family DNA binding protein